MTKIAAGQRLQARNGGRLIEAIAAYDNGHEADFVYVDTREPAGRHKLRAMLDWGWQPV